MWLVAGIGNMRNAERHLGRLGHRWEGNINLDPRQTGFEAWTGFMCLRIT